MALLLHLTAFVASLGQVLALPQKASAPSVTIKNGTVIGQSNGLVDNFLGIPYAQPPIKELRLKPPQSINASYGTINLPEMPAACYQQTQGLFNTSAFPNATAEAIGFLNEPIPGGQDEDCLTINVQRPAGTPSHARLPVLFWIYGGGFEIGTTQNYDGTVIVNQSMQEKSPIIYVAVNYRVSSFGFMGGKELQKDGSTNLGLRDQRLGLQWVADNIAAFGGDPDKVTIWGESAGSVSVMSHLLVNGGDNTYHGRPLFRAGIMDSGSELSTLPVSSAHAQDPYNEVVEACGCSNATDTLQCLRSVPVEKLVAAQNAQPSFFGYAGNNLPFVLRPDPTNDFFPTSGIEPVVQGKFAKVPVIIGDQEDEGSLFALFQPNLTTNDDLIDYFVPFFPEAPRQTVAGWVNTYPQDPAAGSPFGTGDANQLYPQFKRLAAANGDLIFTLPRRQVLGELAKTVPAWSYLATYGHGTPYVGTFHISDIPEVFGHAPSAAIGTEIDRFYLNFVHTLDPNGQECSDATWPKYDVSSKKMLNISSSGLSTLTDDFRQESYEYLVSHFAELAI